YPFQCSPGDQHRWNRLGHAAGRHHDLDHTLHRILFAAAAALRVGTLERSGKVTERPKPGEHGARRLTIRDVARLANVSVGSACKALNNNGTLRQETRDKVIAVAKKLNFRPNDLALSLHRGQSLTVGLISTDSFGRFTIPIMEGLEECLSDRRMAVFMCNATDDPAREARHVEQLLGKRVDGIIVTARRADTRQKLNSPA